MWRKINLLSVLIGGGLLLLWVVSSLAYEMGRQSLADDLDFERATTEEKNAFTQCLLETWETMEDRLDG